MKILWRKKNQGGTTTKKKKEIIRKLGKGHQKTPMTRWQGRKLTTEKTCRKKKEKRGKKEMGEPNEITRYRRTAAGTFKKEGKSEATFQNVQKEETAGKASEKEKEPDTKGGKKRQKKKVHG